MNNDTVKKMPLVSVIIPTYNRGYIIGRSIKSVLNQTYNNLELIIVDDYSNDDTEEIIKEIKDHRLRYIKQECNKGSNAARNRGIEEARGEYIAFQDSDDEWLPNKLEELFLASNNSLDKYGAFFAKTKGIKFDGSSTVFPKCDVLPRDFQKAILLENYICTVSLVVKKQLLKDVGGFDNSLPRLQDWDLAIRLSKKSKILFVNKILVNAYHQKESISADGSKLVKALEIFTNKYETDIKGLTKRQKAKVFNKYGSLISKEGMVSDGRMYFIKAFNCNPIGVKNIIQLIVSLLGAKVYRFIIFHILRKKLL